MDRKKKYLGQIMGPAPEVKPEGESPSDLVMAAQELISAISSKDSEALVSAFKAMFALCEAEPHYEGEHTED